MLIPKSPKHTIKVLAGNSRAENAMQIDHKIYEDIFGNKKNKEDRRKTKVNDSPEPAIPPKATINQNINIINKKPHKSQKMIVFSDIKKKPTKKDLLTQMAGEKRSNTAKPARKHSGRKAAVRVQVAAMSSKKSAQQGWRQLDRSYPSLFDDLKPFIKKVNLGKRGVFYRLQVGDFFNQIEAERFCSRYVAVAKKSKADCIIVE
jgi:hypothetical protein